MVAPHVDCAGQRLQGGLPSRSSNALRTRTRQASVSAAASMASSHSRVCGSPFGCQPETSVKSGDQVRSHRLRPALNATRRPGPEPPRRSRSRSGPRASRISGNAQFKAEVVLFHIDLASTVSRMSSNRAMNCLVALLGSEPLFEGRKPLVPGRVRAGPGRRATLPGRTPPGPRPVSPSP